MPIKTTRTYASRRNYPFTKRVDSCELESGESKDCTVRALAVMANMSYESAHALMAWFGRKPHTGVHVGDAYEHVGLVYTSHRERTTYGKLLKSGLLPYRSIVVTKGHVHAVIDGVTYDTGRIGSSKRVIAWWSYPKESVCNIPASSTV